MTLALLLQHPKICPTGTYTFHLRFYIKKVKDYVDEPAKAFF